MPSALPVGSPRFDLYDGRRGQERNSDSAEVWHAEVWRTAVKFHRRALLGSRLLRFHGEAGRGHGPSVHPQSGGRGRTIRPDDASHEVSRHGRLTVLWAPFEALINSSHWLCRWYLTEAGCFSGSPRSCAASAGYSAPVPAGRFSRSGRSSLVLSSVRSNTRCSMTCSISSLKIRPFE